MQDKVSGLETKKQERREYFRVEDLLPIAIKKIDDDMAQMKGKTIPGLQSGVGFPTNIEEISDDSINPLLWRMLTEINQKLTVLLDNMYLANQGIANIPVKRVCISASGIMVVCDEGFDIGGYVEMKILLTANCSFWVVLYGKVIRTTQLEGAKWEIAIEFSEMGDEVRNALSAYMISRQREMIRKDEWTEG